MLYQKLLAGTDPYFANLSPGCFFELHCHPEIELSFCVKGSYAIIADEKEYILQEGDLAIVKPMVAHELKRQFSADSLRLTVEIGPAFLGDQFAAFVSMNRDNSILRLKPSGHEELLELLHETAELIQEKAPFSDLLVKGNIYKITAVLLKMFAENRSMELAMKTDVEKIGMAINLIYNNYYKPITLDEVSALCGYSKSNFCKLVKMITGESFHVLLNRHRIDVACLQLAETEASIEEIALRVGFADSKSFCRVFKKITGQSAGQFRNHIKRTRDGEHPAFGVYGN